MGNMLKRMKMGFTMVELLVVLVIVAILAAVAAPIYMANEKRSMASEAVAIMSVIRQAERENKVKTGNYVAVDTTVYDLRDKLSVDPETTQYFAQTTFKVTIANPSFTPTTINAVAIDPGAQQFVIHADGKLVAGGGTNVLCPTASNICAAKGDNGDLQNIQVEMDNSGRIFVTYNGGTTWEQY
jgi:type IV pilus assembly protein PilE